MLRFSGGFFWVLLAGALGWSCSKHPPADVGDAGTAAAKPVAEATQVLARVGNRTITVGDYVAALEHMDQFDRMRYQAPERRQELLSEMVDVMLLADYAREKGYDQDPVTQQEIREILRDAMLKKARDGVPAPSAIPDDETRAYYDAHRADFHDPERRRVSAIVLGSEAAASAVLAQAKKASPTEWGELVKARSVDAHAQASVPSDLAGDLGFVGPPGDPRGGNPRVPEEVRAGIFEVAQVGDVLPRVVKAGSNAYVLRLSSRTEPHDRTFDDAKRAIQIKLVQERIRAKEDALLDDLRRQYPVQIDESVLADVRVDLPRTDGGH